MGNIKSILDSQQELEKQTIMKISLQNEHSSAQKIQGKSNSVEKDIKNQEDFGGFIKQTILKGVDNRKMVTDEEISQLPYRLIGYLHSQFKGENYTDGTGVLVAPNLVLTAAHNVYQYGLKTRICKFSLAHNKGKSSYIFEVDVNKIFIPKSYSEKGADDKNNAPFDYALLVLKPNTAFQEQKLREIDYQISKFMHLLQESVDYEANFHESAIIAGYPQQLNKGSLQIAVSGCQYAGTGLIQSNKKLKMISYSIATTPGQSGAPIVVEIQGIKYIIGIHTLGGYNINKGISVRSMKDDLNEWCKSINGKSIVDTLQNWKLKHIIPPLVKISSKQMKQIPFHRVGFIKSKSSKGEMTTSGCLIAPYLVLTTAQAIYFIKNRSIDASYQFILGHHSEGEGDSIRFQVDHVLFKKEFMKTSGTSDYALLVLRKETIKKSHIVSKINNQPFLPLSCYDAQYAKTTKITMVGYLYQANDILEQKLEKDHHLNRSLGRMSQITQYLSYEINAGKAMSGSPILMLQNNLMHIIGIHKASDANKQGEKYRFGVKLSSMKDQVQIWLQYLTGISIKMEDVPKHNIRELIDSRKVKLPRIIN